MKIMWDFQSMGGDGMAHFFYSYWDRGEKRRFAFGAGATAPFDARGTPLPSKGKIRRYIDVGRLTKGR